MHAALAARTLLLLAACSPPRAEPPAPRAAAVQDAARPAPAPFDHSAFDALLKKYVKGDRVDYAALKKGREPLDAYVGRLAALPAADLAAMPRADRFAFWIDAYNALTLQTIVDHYPIRAGLALNPWPKNSIRQIDGAWTAQHTVASRSVSLDDIENKILRPEFKDPRVHAAINCASLGCPPLRAEAFTGEKLQAQLDDNFERFLADRRRNVIDPGGEGLKISQIFDWFKDDFGGAAGVLDFLRKHAPEGVRAKLAGVKPAAIHYLDYDWTLNDV
jgi:hypothetical protein